MYKVHYVSDSEHNAGKTLENMRAVIRSKNVTLNGLGFRGHLSSPDFQNLIGGLRRRAG
jgi:hypothetical protein